MRSVIITAVCLFILNHVPIQAQTTKSSSGQWNMKSPMPEALHSQASGVIEGILYIAGGYKDFDVSVKTVYAYNPVTDTWTRKTDAPYSFERAGSVVYNKKLYVFAGMTVQPENLDYVSVYDPATDTWTELKRLPSPQRRAPFVGIYNNQIFLTGGMARGGPRSETEIYLPEYDIWSYWGAAQLPVPCHAGSAEVYGNKMFVFGGMGSDHSEPYDITAMNTLQIYDFVQNEWEEGPPMSLERDRVMTCVYDDWIYVFGGMTSGEIKTHSSYIAYNPANKYYINSGHMPLPIADGACELIGDKIYVAGGFNDDVIISGGYHKTNPVNTVWEFNPHSLGTGILVIDIDPDSASYSQDIVIHGAFFGEYSENCAVSFNGIHAEKIFEWSTNRIQTEIPDSATSGPVYVINGADSSNAYHYTIAKQPVITKLEESNLSESFDLHQNFPNPFNAGTTFRFTLPELTGVKLSIYSVAGELVRTITDDMYSGGVYQVYWDGTNNNAGSVASGQYIARITTGRGFAKSIKLTVLK